MMMMIIIAILLPSTDVLERERISVHEDPFLLEEMIIEARDYLGHETPHLSGII